MPFRGGRRNIGGPRLARLARRTIRRVIVVASTAIIVNNGAKYYNDGHQQYLLQSVDGKSVIEDPNDQNSYIEIQVSN